MRHIVSPKQAHSLYERREYSAAVRSGDLLFVSGQVGSTADGSPEPDFEKQVRLAFTHLLAVLRAAGCSFKDVVYVTTFRTDPEKQFPDVMRVRTQLIGEAPYPNLTAAGVNWLAGFDFEIEVIARITS